MSNNTRDIPHYSDKGQYPDSYYAASRNPKPDRPTLKMTFKLKSAWSVAAIVAYPRPYI